jgi:hypothetical protein
MCRCLQLGLLTKPWFYANWFTIFKVFSFFCQSHLLPPYPLSPFSFYVYVFHLINPTVQFTLQCSSQCSIWNYSLLISFGEDLMQGGSVSNKMEYYKWDNIGILSSVDHKLFGFGISTCMFSCLVVNQNVC